jgi:hypothetical protein
MNAAYVTTFLLLLASPALAQSAGTGDWTGFYGGVSYANGTFSDDGGANDVDVDALGLQVGYLQDLGTFVWGGELAYLSGDYGDTFPDNDWNSTRLKLIGGYDAGRILPYGFVGISSYEIGGISEFSDSVGIYGIGATYAVTQQILVGLEYTVENKDGYDNSFDMENSDVALRLNYKF